MNKDSVNSKLSEQFQHILKCTVSDEKFGRLLLASKPDKRYPYIYPRDTSAAVQLFRRVAGSKAGYDAGPDAFALLKNTAEFMMAVQSPEGCWGQRYGLNGEDKSIYIQEDNTAHGISILCNYLLTAERLNRNISDLDEYLERIDKAMSYVLKHYYKRELNLFYSTTAIHESHIERGYSCWVNFSYLYAMNLAKEVAEIFPDKKIISEENLSLHKQFSYEINELFMSGDRYIRRFDPNGHMDMRPDFTLLSPFYYGIIGYKKELDRSVNFLRKQLYDPELGMIMRYLPFFNDFAIHIHAGSGPWLQYSAILAQYHYWNKNTEAGDELMDRIDHYKNEDGEIPEHLSTCNRFDAFMELEWQTGKDYKKEFYEDILLPDCTYDKILEETNNMKKSYDETGKLCMKREDGHREGGYIQFTTPLMWSHVEYARALLVKAGDWWKIQ